MSRNARLSAVRGWAHDRMCMSQEPLSDAGGGCPPGDSDHARRTQHPFAKAYVDAADDHARAAAVHRLVCLAAARGHCEATEPHLAIITDRILPTIPNGDAP